MEKEYLEKYKKYKSKFLTLKKIKKQKGGGVKEDIIVNPQTICNLVETLPIDFHQKNEGRHNLGIGFYEDLFFKFGNTGELKPQFETGRIYAKLKSIYPYFIDVYGYFNCMTSDLGKIGTMIEKTSERNVRSSKITNVDIMVTQKGENTIYQYINNSIYKIIKKNIPNYEELVTQLDSIYFQVLKNNGYLIVKDIKYGGYDMIDPSGKKVYSIEDKEVEKKIMKEYEDLIAPLLKDIFLFSLKFKSTILPLIMKNLKVIAYQHLLIDMISLLYMNNSIVDIKADNFMIHTEPWDPTTANYIRLKIKDETIQMVNVVDWGDHKEAIYIYPVDFPTIDLRVLSTINDLIPDASLDKIHDYGYTGKPKTIRDNINQIVGWLLGYSFYSDVKSGTSEDTLKYNCIDMYGLKLSYFSNPFIAIYNPFTFTLSAGFTGEIRNLFSNRILSIDFTRIEDLKDLFIYVYLIMKGDNVPTIDHRGKYYQGYSSKYDYQIEGYRLEPLLTIEL